jgi:hypothetical protein
MILRGSVSHEGSYAIVGDSCYLIARSESTIYACVFAGFQNDPRGNLCAGTAQPDEDCRHYRRRWRLRHDRRLGICRPSARRVSSVEKGDDLLNELSLKHQSAYCGQQSIFGVRHLVTARNLKLILIANIEGRALHAAGYAREQFKGR